MRQLMSSPLQAFNRCLSREAMQEAEAVQAKELL